MKGFKPLFTLPVPGVVNSLQLLSPPLNTVRVNEKGEASTTAINIAEWKRKHGLNTDLTPHPDSQDKGDEQAEKEKGKKLDKLQATKDNSPPILIIGVGQEHKFGRWIKLRSNEESKVRNGALVIPLQLTATAQQQNGSGKKAFKLV